MKDEGLTIISRCGQPPIRLVSDRVRSFEWESYARREPKPARERLGPLKLCKPGDKRGPRCSPME